MKKLFISCPMRGRTEENIRKSMDKMHKIAEIMFDQKLEVIPTYIDDNPPENNNKALWYLGKSIQLMAEADYFIGIDWDSLYRGCSAERSIASEYEIPSVYVESKQLMPDVRELQEAYWKEQEKCFTNSPESNLEADMRKKVQDGKL